MTSLEAVRLLSYDHNRHYEQRRALLDLTGLTSEARDGEQRVRELAQTPNAIIVAELGRRGLVATSNTSDGKDIPFLSANAVHPDCQNFGIGAMMTRAVIDIHATRADAQDEVSTERPSTSELLVDLPPHLMVQAIEYINSNHGEKLLPDFYKKLGFKVIAASLIMEKVHDPPLSFMPTRGIGNRPSINDSLALVHNAYCDPRDKDQIPSQRTYHQYGISQMNKMLSDSEDPFLRDIQIPFDHDTNGKEKNYATIAATPKHPFIDRESGEVTFWRRWLGLTDTSRRYKIFQAWDYGESGADNHDIGNPAGYYLGLDTETHVPFAFSIEHEIIKDEVVAQLQSPLTSEQLYQNFRHAAGYFGLPEKI